MRIKNSEVIQIARRIIADHEKAQQEIMLIARANTITLPNQPNPLQQASYTHLSKLSGSAFDKKYIASQIQEHTNHINLFHMYTEVGNSMEVRQFAKKTIPALATHAEGFRQLARQMGIPATYGRPPVSQLARRHGAMKAASNARMNNGTTRTANAGRP